MQQEISKFYNGINLFTLHLLDSQGQMKKKVLTTNKSLIEEFAKHSRLYYIPRDDVTRGKANRDGGQENVALIIAKLDPMDKRITKMGQFIHAMQVGYDNCHGPHLTMDYDLDDNRNRKA